MVAPARLLASRLFSPEKATTATATSQDLMFQGHGVQVNTWIRDRSVFSTRECVGEICQRDCCDGGSKRETCSEHNARTRDRVESGARERDRKDVERIRMRIIINALHSTLHQFGFCPIRSVGGLRQRRSSWTGCHSNAPGFQLAIICRSGLGHLAQV